MANYTMIDSKICTVKGSLYYIIHDTTFCKTKRFGEVYTLHKNAKSDMYRCNSDVHANNVRNGKQIGCTVTFYDKNCGEIEQRFELDTIYKPDNGDVFDVLDSYLDPNVRYDVTGIVVGLYSKDYYGNGLFFTIKLAGKVKNPFIMWLKYKENLTKSDVLDYIEQLKLDPLYTKYDLSKITIDNIGFAKPPAMCTIM